MSQMTPREIVQELDKHIIEFIIFGHGDHFVPSKGEVFGDGSCTHPSDPPLSRAGFAVCQVNSDADLISAIFGCIPRNLPQDSLTAEHTALSVALDNSNQAVYKGDCSNVLSSFHAGFGAAM